MNLTAALHNTAVYDSNPELSDRAHNLADSLQIPCLPKAHTRPIQYRFLLFFETDRLCIWTQDFSHFSPFYVDFLSGKLAYRLQYSTHQRSPIAKAVGLKHQSQPSILDLTAGFGQDASLLAYAGCSVILIEKNPIVFALLDDGIKRARQIQPSIFNRLSPICTDALAYCKSLLTDPKTQKPNVVYYDPMFPAKTKSAANQKPMQLLQSIVGCDHNTEELFKLTQQIAKERVVVKRPKRAKSIFDSVPDTRIAMVKHRFDIYFPNL